MQYPSVPLRVLFLSDDCKAEVAELWQRVYKLEGDKFDLERAFQMKAFEVTIGSVPHHPYLTFFRMIRNGIFVSFYHTP